MALVEWKEEFKVGIASVDHEHRQLIGLINDLHGGLAAHPTKVAIADMLGEIHAKIAAHFALEERVMRERRYDQYDDHKADHERLLDEIRDIMDRHDSDAYFHYEAALARELDAWFAVHFRTRDSRLHKALGF